MATSSVHNGGGGGENSGYNRKQDDGGFKMKTVLTSTVLAGFMLATSIATGAEDPQHMMHTPPKGSAQLEQMKQLVGAWEGTDPMSKTGEKMMVEYFLTAGGSAVMERFMAGSDHEMVTMYYDRGGKLNLTHYCTLGNQPAMEMKKADAKMLQFDLVKGGVTSEKEPHMHGLTITFDGADKVSHSWTMYEEGKAVEPKMFKFSRKK